MFHELNQIKNQLNGKKKYDIYKTPTNTTNLDHFPQLPCLLHCIQSWWGGLFDHLSYGLLLHYPTTTHGLLRSQGMYNKLSIVFRTLIILVKSVVAFMDNMSSCLTQLTKGLEFILPFPLKFLQLAEPWNWLVGPLSEPFLKVNDLICLSTTCAKEGASIDACCRHISWLHKRAWTSSTPSNIGWEIMFAIKPSYWSGNIWRSFVTGEPAILWLSAISFILE